MTVSSFSSGWIEEDGRPEGAALTSVEHALLSGRGV
jgi:hypothetical protein